MPAIRSPLRPAIRSALRSPLDYNYGADAADPTAAILMDDGFYLLQDDGSKLLLWG